jgi:hypothetical protein
MKRLSECEKMESAEGRTNTGFFMIDLYPVGVKDEL